MQDQGSTSQHSTSQHSAAQNSAAQQSRAPARAASVQAKDQKWAQRVRWAQQHYGTRKAAD